MPENIAKKEIIHLRSLLNVKFSKRKLFRKLVNLADNIDIWINEKFNLNPKKKILIAKQDMTTRTNFDKTIGRALGVKRKKQ